MCLQYGHVTAFSPGDNGIETLEVIGSSVMNGVLTCRQTDLSACGLFANGHVVSAYLSKVVSHVPFVDCYLSLIDDFCLSTVNASQEQVCFIWLVNIYPLPN